MSIELILLVALGAGLAMIALALLTIKALNAAAKLALALAVAVGLLVVGIIALQGVTIPTLVDVSIERPSTSPERDTPAQRPAVRAATSITLTLAAVLAVGIIGAVGAFAAWRLWEEKQTRERLELMAAIYGGDRERQRRELPYRRRAPRRPAPDYDYEPVEWEVMR